MRSAFTMIEMIFVIVIIGVLAVIAVPRYFGVESEAETNTAKAFAATLYRTVGHSFWSKSLAMGAGGSIKNDNDGDNSLFYGRKLEEYVTIPKYFDASSVDFSKCVQAGQVAQPFITKKSGVGEYNIFCRDGNATTAPLFVADTNNTYQF